jgi:hypothetical protein
MRNYWDLCSNLPFIVKHSFVRNCSICFGQLQLVAKTATRNLFITCMLNCLRRGAFILSDLLVAPASAPLAGAERVARIRTPRGARAASAVETHL